VRERTVSRGALPALHSIARARRAGTSVACPSTVASRAFLPLPPSLDSEHCGKRRHAPRRFADSILYEVLRTELETFLARAAARERPAPRFVARELRAFLRCGVLAHGFVRVHCDACGLDRVIPFSCKGRGFCPSCGGRRMADTAPHLVERVLPEAPVRQWVLSLPFALRYRLAYDAPLASAVLAIFIRAVFASLRRRARTHWNLPRTQCGAVTFVQRFGDALNLNVDFHSLVLDGVYAHEASGSLRFHPLPPPDDAEVVRVARGIARQIVRLLERRGLADANGPVAEDALERDEPLLAALAASSVAGRVATGPRAGRPVLRVGDRIDADDLPQLAGERCASVGGVSLHANVAVPTRDRSRLERLCRYVARPPLATQRLSRLGDGRLLYRLKHRWRDGTTHVVFEPQELVERLAALIPPPRLHGARYHGVFGSRARKRARIVPTAVSEAGRRDAEADAQARSDSECRAPSSAEAPAMAPVETSSSGRGASTQPAPSARESATASHANIATPRIAPRPRRLAWADLLKRVFAIDVLACPRCGARTRVLSVPPPPDAAGAILACLGLPSRAPPPAAPRPDDVREDSFAGTD